MLIPGFDKDGFSVGLRQDLDADGDLDVGSNVVSSSDDFWFARHNTTASTGAAAGAPDGVRVGFGTILISNEPFFDGQDHIHFLAGISRQPRPTSRMVNSSAKPRSRRHWRTASPSPNSPSLCSPDRVHCLPCPWAAGGDDDSSEIYALHADSATTS